MALTLPSAPVQNNRPTTGGLTLPKARTQQSFQSAQPTPAVDFKNSPSNINNPQSPYYQQPKPVNEGLGAPIGRLLQKIPSPNLGTRGKDVFKATETETKIVDFLSNMPSAILNSWGKSLETLSTPDGRTKLKEDAKRLPQTAQEVKDHLSKKEWGQAMQTAFDNSAVSVGMDVADFIPITWLGKAGLKGINASLRKTGQQIVKEGLEEAGFKTVKEVFEPVKVPEVPKAEVKPVTSGLEGGGGIGKEYKPVEQILDKPMTVYHGAPNENIASIKKSGLKIEPEGRSNITTEGNYGVSFSTSEEIARKYADQYGGSVLTTKLPKGTKVLKIDTQGYGVDQLSYNDLQTLKNKGYGAIIDISEGQEAEVRLLNDFTKSLSGLEGGVKVEPKEVSVPREQLPIGGGEEKVSRLEARVQKVLDDVSPEKREELGLSTYQQMNKKETIARASEYVTKNPEDALKVLKGEIEAPKDIPPESIYVAMVNSAKDDVTLATKLSTLRATALGQRISLLTEIDEGSPVKIAREIFEIKEEVFKKRYGGKSSQEVIKNLADKGKNEIKPPSKLEWGSLISDIRCK